MRAAALFLIVLMGAASAEARMKTDISLRANAQATISIGCCFDNVCMDGYAPIDVTINNHSGQPRQWSFTFSSPAYVSEAMDTMGSTFTVTVENNGTRTFPLMTPMGPVERGGIPLMVSIAGYGVDGSTTAGLGGRSWSGKQPTPFVVISESLGTPIWSTLSSMVDSQAFDLTGSTVNPDDLPEDWRGLSGVAGLWLTGDELNRLSAAQRDAIQTWVHMGGWLMLCNVKDVPRDLQVAGFGRVLTVPAPLDVKQTSGILDALSAYDGLSNNYKHPPAGDLGPVRPNVPLLSGFMGLFAIVVGPVNVFVLARRRRERLFWTTPLISLCASGLLMGMIVMQDGPGGHGVRSALVFVFPDSRSEVVRQEQISRTGLLLGSAFQTRDPVCMRQLTVDNDGSLKTVFVATYSMHGRALRIDGTACSGDWFISRAAQAQRIVAVTPTRAEIAVLNPAEARAGAAPVIVSSFRETLDTLDYTVDSAHRWEGKEVRTGQKQTLQPSPWKFSVPDQLPNPPSDAIERFSHEPGYFAATSHEGGSYIETLGAIHWKDEPVTYVGPVTSP